MTIKAQTGPGRPLPQPAIYVARRVTECSEADLRSERLRCARCRAAVLVDPLAYVPVKLLQDTLRVLCVDCAAELEKART